MTTKMKTAGRSNQKSRKTSEKDLLAFPSFPAVENDSESVWQESGSHNSPSGVADMDNLVYLYLSEWGNSQDQRR